MRHVEEHAREHLDAERDRQEHAQHVAERARGLQRVAHVPDDDGEERQRGRRHPAPDRRGWCPSSRRRSRAPTRRTARSVVGARRTSEISSRRATSIPIPSAQSATMIVTYVTRPARRSIANDENTAPRTTSVKARAKDAEASSVLSHPGCAASPGADVTAPASSARHARSRRSARRGRLADVRRLLDLVGEEDEQQPSPAQQRGGLGEALHQEDRDRERRAAA